MHPTELLMSYLGIIQAENEGGGFNWRGASIRENTVVGIGVKLVNSTI